LITPASNQALVNASTVNPSLIDPSPRSTAMLTANLMNEQLARSRHLELLNEAERERLARRTLARHRLRRRVRRAEQAAHRARLALLSL
jgi:hypothetical protein